MISPASTSACSLEISSFFCSAAAIAISAACFVFSHSSRTSSMLACADDAFSSMVSSSAFSSAMASDNVSSGFASVSGSSFLSDSSAFSAISLSNSFFNRSSTCSLIFSLSNVKVSSASCSPFRYGISPTIFLMFSMVSTTVSFLVASMICFILFASSSSRLEVLNLLAITVVSGVFTISWMTFLRSGVAGMLISTIPFFSRNCLYFSSCAGVSG